MMRELHEAAPRWVRLGLKERIALLKESMKCLEDVAEEWVALCCRAKGLTQPSAGEGEEWFAGVVPTMRNLRLLAMALEAGGAPKPAKLTQREGGQWVARVFPLDLMETAMFAGVTADLWIQPGEEPSQGRVYREKVAGKEGDGGVGVVLGAGNQSSIAPMDVLYKLFADDEVCILKMNPVNEYLGETIAKALAPFVRQGYVRVVYGGAEVGNFLCTHDLAASIHMTGSTKVHDIIVWGGDPEEQAKNKAAGTPRVDIPVSSELGCITPVLVVPGPWTEAELDYQARHVCGMVTYNAGFNCNGAKALVMPKAWEHRDRFVALVEEKLKAHPARKAYYPGAERLWEQFTTRYPEHTTAGDKVDEVVPWTVLHGVEPRQGEYALENEPWCGVISVIDIDAHSAEEFLAAAVPFCNDHLWGTLSSVMLVHPKTEKAHAAAVNKAIADLRYGGVGVNNWTGLQYGLATPTWGAFPGHPLEDVVSGRGVVHNALLFDHPEKSVVRSPFIMKPTPAWFVDHKNGPAMARKLVRFEAKPSWLRLPGVAIQAFKG